MNGIVVLDKASGCSSFSAVRDVRRVFGGEKAGHAGTLDPMATGVLPVFLGRATKLIGLLPETRKEYEATALLGASTDTGDAEGAVIERGGRTPSEAELAAALAAFLGQSEQLPPMYSAIKQNGRPLYALAREGKTAARQPRPITLYEAALTGYGEGRFSFRVACSAGTYVRTLAEDVAARCGALCHLTALRRTAACGFSAADARDIGALRALAETGGAEAALLPAETPFLAWPALALGGDLMRLFQNGFVFEAARAGCRAPEGTRLRVLFEGRFAGLAELTPEGGLRKLWQSET